MGDKDKMRGGFGGFFPGPQIIGLGGLKLPRVLAFVLEKAEEHHAALLHDIVVASRTRPPRLALQKLENGVVAIAG
ncbi:MAG: hypothetical protein ALAOOOJD_03735 [bacterium]|nr:hypothetical protein [bacterium]